MDNLSKRVRRFLEERGEEVGFEDNTPEALPEPEDEEELDDPGAAPADDLPVDDFGDAEIADGGEFGVEGDAGEGAFDDVADDEGGAFDGPEYPYDDFEDELPDDDDDGGFGDEDNAGNAEIVPADDGGVDIHLTPDVLADLAAQADADAATGEDDFGDDEFDDEGGDFAFGDDEEPETFDWPEDEGEPAGDDEGGDHGEPDGDDFGGEPDGDADDEGSESEGSEEFEGSEEGSEFDGDEGGEKDKSEACKAPKKGGKAGLSGRPLKRTGFNGMKDRMGKVRK